MNAVITTALAGLRAAEARFAISAHNIVNAQSTSSLEQHASFAKVIEGDRIYHPKRPAGPSLPLTAGNLTRFTGTGDPAGLQTAATPSLIQNFVEMKLALRSYEANLRVFSAAVTLEGEFLDRLL